MFLGGGAANAEAPSKSEDHSDGQGLSSSGASVGAWGGESKLSDVVKGVAKPNRSGYYGGGNKPLLNGPVLGTSGSPASVVNLAGAVTTTTAQTTPTTKPASLDSQAVAAAAVVVVASSSLPNGDLAQSTLALTPPTSPGKRDKSFPATTGNSTSAPTANQTNALIKTAKGQQPSPSTLSSVANEIVTTPPSSIAASKTTHTSSTAPSTVPATAPPCVSYAKMAEQNKDRLEQMAREAKERELEQERERRRNVQTSWF